MLRCEIEWRSMGACLFDPSKATVVLIGIVGIASIIMKFYIEEVKVIFPYEYIYPEQLEYMTELKRGLDRRGHMLLEMPSGTGKTISLLSLLVAYLNHHRTEKIKLVYCTRTVVEMTKTVEELRRLVARWASDDEDLRPLVALCLSARKNLCLHPEVSALTYTQEVDAACRTLQAGWSDNGARCEYYEPFSTMGPGTVRLPPGIYSLDDLRTFGREMKACPYFLARTALESCDIVIQSYLYLVDPKVSGVVKEALTSNTIVVMDEGHNVDDVCIESMSMVVTKSDARNAKERNMRELHRLTEEVRATNRQRLQDEYDRLVSGLQLASMAQQTRSDRDLPQGRPVQRGDTSNPGPGIAASAGPPAELLSAMELPGALRHATQFLSFLSRIAEFFFRLVARMNRPQVADPLTFLTKMKEECSVDIRHLRFTAERLTVLLNTLQVRDTHQFRHIALVADFVATLAEHYKDERYALPGYVVVFEPFDPMDPTIPDPVLRLSCVDASLAVRDVFSSYRSVVLTSGTLSPLDIYPKMLGFVPVLARSFPMTLSRKCICPVIVTRSADQANLTEELTSSYKVRTDEAAQAHVSASYATFLINLAKTVPDGICCFFTGYRYMGEVLLHWHAHGVLEELSRHKLIFIETQGVSETSQALASYRRACDIGRGAIFISIARGKIAEGIDFDRHYGRAVVMFGVPFLPPDDKGLQERIRWMETCLGISDSEFRNFDAMRQASQCIGRVLRNKTDYGMMILVDRRFALNDKKRKLPEWIQQQIKENSNLSTDAAVTVARRFFKEMAQPWDQHKDLGSTLFDLTALRSKGLLVPQDTNLDLEGEEQAAANAEAVDRAGLSMGLRPVAEHGAAAATRKPKRSRD
jgi:DNA excision repair protein ERCC-2